MVDGVTIYHAEKTENKRKIFNLLKSQSKGISSVEEIASKRVKTQKILDKDERKRYDHKHGKKTVLDSSR